MLFASSFAEGVLNLFLLLAIAGWLIRRFLAKHDAEGKIGGAVTKGFVSMLGRWLK